MTRSGSTPLGVGIVGAGWLGKIRFARFNYLSRITETYAGWSWCRTARRGWSHLLAAGCHAVDGLRWCSGLELTEVSAYHTRFTAGYQYPTSIVVNLRLGSRALGQVVSSTGFMTPYSFGIELMGDRATLRDHRLTWHDTPLDVDRLARENPFDAVSLVPETRPTGVRSVRVDCLGPESGDVTHHPFQDEIDELVECVLDNRPTRIDVFDAQIEFKISPVVDDEGFMRAVGG